MPRVRRRRRRRKKKYARSKRHRKKRSMTIPRLPFGLRKTVRMRYVTPDLLIPTAAGIPAQHTFRTNSVYDPDYTGTGHQPLYYDELGKIYKQYCVIGFRAKFTIRQNSNTTTCIALCLDSDTASIVDLPTRIENGTCKKIIMNGANQVQRNRTMYISSNPNKFLTVSNPLGADEVKGESASGEVIAPVTGSNPAKEAFLKVVVLPLDSLSTASVSVFCELEYVVVWLNPNTADQS